MTATAIGCLTGSVGLTQVRPIACDYHDRIGRDPKIAGGQAVIKGTRATLRTGLASLAEGATIEEILKDFRRSPRWMFVP